MISIKITWNTYPHRLPTKHEHTIIAADWDIVAIKFEQFLKERKLNVDDNEVYCEAS